MTGQTTNHMENLPSEMRKIIRESMKTKADRRSYAACSDLIASELFNLSTCNMMGVEQAKSDVYKIRIGMENSFDTIVTLRNVENNCEIKWNYFSVSLDDPPLIIENSDSEKEVVRMFEEYLKKYGEQIKTLVLKKVDINFNIDSFPELKNLEHLKIETSNENMAKYFIEKLTTMVTLEIRSIGDNFSNDIIADLPQLEKISSLKFFLKTITDEQFMKIATNVGKLVQNKSIGKLETQMGNMTVDGIKKFIISRLDRTNRTESKISIVASSPFSLKQFRDIPATIDNFAARINAFENEELRFFRHGCSIGLKNFRYQNRLQIRIEPNSFFGEDPEFLVRNQRFLDPNEIMREQDRQAEAEARLRDPILQEQIQIFLAEQRAIREQERMMREEDPNEIIRQQELLARLQARLRDPRRQERPHRFLAEDIIIQEPEREEEE